MNHEESTPGRTADETLQRFQEEVSVKLPVNVSIAEEIHRLRSQLSEEVGKRSELQSELEAANEKYKKLKNRRWINKYGQFNGQGQWVPGLWQQHKLLKADVVDVAVGTSDDAESSGSLTWMKILVFGTLLLVVAGADFLLQPLYSSIANKGENAYFNTTFPYSDYVSSYGGHEDGEHDLARTSSIQRVELEAEGVPSELHLQHQDSAGIDADVAGLISHTLPFAFTSMMSADENNEHQQDLPIPLLDSGNSRKFLSALPLHAGGSLERHDDDYVAPVQKTKESPALREDTMGLVRIRNAFAEKSASLRTDASASMLVSSLVADLYDEDAAKNTETLTELVNYCTIAPDAVDFAVQSGVIPRLIQLVSNAKEVSSQTAAEALAWISERDESYRSLVVQQGAIPKLVRLLDGSSMQKRSAARALQTVAHDNHIKKVLNSGAVKKLVALLKEPDSEGYDIAMQAAVTLFNVVNGDDHLLMMKARIKIAKYGGIELSLFTLKRRGFQDPELASWILKLLRNLVMGDHTNRRKLLDANALALIVSFLKPRGDYLSVRTQAAGILWKLCDDVRAKKRILEAGAKKQLLEMVRDGDETGKTRALLLLNRLEDHQGKHESGILI